MNQYFIINRMTSNMKLRLATKVAHFYYEKGLLQKQIAEQMYLSQASISRLLRKAREENIVRTQVSIPVGVYSNIESLLEEKYGLKEAIIAEVTSDSDEEITRVLGNAAAYYLETTLSDNEIIGISSWSTNLLAMVNAMQPLDNLKGIKVVQILGGLGNPAAKNHANHLIKHLSSMVNGEPIFMPAPGIAPKKISASTYKEDDYVKLALDMFKEITTAIVGIGTMKPSELLANSGNFFSPEELESLKDIGAVGDICLHFFNDQGNPVRSSLDQRVIGMSLADIKNTPRSIGIAGGKRKVEAILASLRGNYLDILITDNITAEIILDHS